jgi:hypothetical protein
LKIPALISEPIKTKIRGDVSPQIVFYCPILAYSKPGAFTEQTKFTDKKELNSTVYWKAITLRRTAPESAGTQKAMS